MKELRIYDKVEDKEYILCLGELIKIVETIDADTVTGEWTINKGAYGYGELICSIEDSLENNNQYTIEGSTIFPILKSGEQYFYNAILKKDNSEIEIGINDSTYLFVRSNNVNLLKQVKNYFRNGIIE